MFSVNMFMPFDNKSPSHLKLFVFSNSFGRVLDIWYILWLLTHVFEILSFKCQFNVIKISDWILKWGVHILVSMCSSFLTSCHHVTIDKLNSSSFDTSTQHIVKPANFLHKKCQYFRNFWFFFKLFLEGLDIW